MAFTRINPSGWAVGDKLTSAQINALDTQLANALDKSSAGDTMNGLITIPFGGGGRIYCAKVGSIQGGVTSAIQSNAAGGITSQSTGGITSGVDGGLSLSGSVNDWLTYGTARTRTVIVPLTGAYPQGINTSGGGDVASNAIPLTYTGASSTGALSFPGAWNQQALTGYGACIGTTVAYSADTAHAYGFLIPIQGHVHNGATLSAAALTFFPTIHGSLPTKQPFFGVFRQLTTSGNPNGALPMVTTTSPFVQSNVATVGAYSNVPITIQQNLTVNNVIDKSQYQYFVYVFDEYGPNAIAGATFWNVALTFTGINDSRPA